LDSAIAQSEVWTPESKRKINSKFGLRSKISQKVDSAKVSAKD